MGWFKLTQLPGQQVIDEAFPDIIYWCINGAHVLHQGRKLGKADVESFEVWLPYCKAEAIATADFPFVARDKAGVYFAWRRLPKVDCTSLRHSGGRYWQDDRCVYSEGETSLNLLKNADSRRFKVLLDSDYATDGLHVWYAARLLKNADAASFTVLKADTAYAQDKAQVYFEGAILPNADLTTWQYLKYGFSRDKKAAWYCTETAPRGYKKLAAASARLLKRC